VAHIRIIQQEEATGPLAEDYAAISRAYSGSFGRHIPTPQVYRTHSLLEPYFHYGATQIGGTSTAEQYLGKETVPGILANFAVAMYSSCFY
jgi:hypothetical protein